MDADQVGKGTSARAAEPAESERYERPELEWRVGGYVWLESCGERQAGEGPMGLGVLMSYRDKRCCARFKAWELDPAGSREWLKKLLNWAFSKKEVISGDSVEDMFPYLQSFHVKVKI